MKFLQSFRQLGVQAFLALSYFEVWNIVIDRAILGLRLVENGNICPSSRVFHGIRQREGAIWGADRGYKIAENRMEMKN